MAPTDAGPTRGRYGSRELECGTVTIYDTENDEAWLRSDVTVSVAWRT